MSGDIYRALQVQLDQYSVGFPAAPSGSDQRLLRRLFSEEDAALFLDMSLLLETPDSVAGRTGRDPEATAGQLRSMAERGLVFRLLKNDVAKYAAVPFVVGSFEFQLPVLDCELAALIDAYWDEVFADSFKGLPSFMRAIPVRRTIPVNYPVAPYDDARAILAGQKKIAVANCICRVSSGLLEKSCHKPLEVCFMFGSHAQYYMDRGMARPVGVEEGLAILDTCEAEGLVTQPYNAVNPGGMCNCCGDCCGVLKGLKKNDKPALMAVTSYYAEVDAETCIGCETCLPRCQMDAITMADDGVARVNLDRCIGCGLCVTTCPTESMRLLRKPDDLRPEPPKSGREQMEEMARLRGRALIPLSMGGRPAGG